MQCSKRAESEDQKGLLQGKNICNKNIKGHLKIYLNIFLHTIRFVVLQFGSISQTILSLQIDFTFVNQKILTSYGITAFLLKI